MPTIHGSVMLTEDNVERIIEVAAKRGFTLESFRNNIRRNALRGKETILFTIVHQNSQQIGNFNPVPYDPSIHPVFDVPLMETHQFIALLETTPEDV